MITEYQKYLLKIAARRPCNSEGSIASIFFVAVDMNDEDTVEYIMQTYLTEDHFDSDALKALQMIEAEMQAEQQLHH